MQQQDNRLSNLAGGQMRSSIQGSMVNQNQLSRGRQTISRQVPASLLQSSQQSIGYSGNQSARSQSHTKVSMVPGLGQHNLLSKANQMQKNYQNVDEGSQMQGLSQNAIIKHKTLNDIDFSKPEKHLKEILEFLRNVTILSDNKDLFKNIKTINGQQAQYIIFHLIKVFAPNYTTSPKFEEIEIQSLFKLLNYPGSIRSDAIKAVGAQTSIAFLMRALYWLYLVTKIYYIEKQPVVINDSDSFIREDDDEDRQSVADQKSSKKSHQRSASQDDQLKELTKGYRESNILGKDQIMKNYVEELVDEDEENFYDPREKVFLELLREAQMYQSYQIPHQSAFQLSNQIKLKIRPVIQLLMHEYQEYLHRPLEIDFDQIYDQVCGMIYNKLDEQKELISQKEHMIKIVKQEILEKEQTTPNLDKLVLQINDSVQQTEQSQKDQQLLSMQKEQRKSRIEALRAQIQKEKSIQAQHIYEKDQLLQTIRNQPITRQQADIISNETFQNKQDIQALDLSINQLNDQYKMIETQIVQSDKEIAQLALQVNQSLIILKLQEQGRPTELANSTPGKYSKGLHIKMLPDGRLDGVAQMENDVRPIVDELKLRWREKLDIYDRDKAQLNDELVQNEIDLRNLQDEVKHIQDQFKQFQQQVSGNLGSKQSHLMQNNLAITGPLSQASDKLRKDCDLLKQKYNNQELEIESIQKQIDTVRIELRDLEIDLQRLTQENEESSHNFKQNQFEIQRIKQSLMENLIAFRQNVSGLIITMKSDVDEYYEKLAPIFANGNLNSARMSNESNVGQDQSSQPPQFQQQNQIA
eukprot:403339673